MQAEEKVMYFEDTNGYSVLRFIYGGAAVLFLIDVLGRGFLSRFNFFGPTLKVQEPSHHSLHLMKLANSA